MSHPNPVGVPINATALRRRRQLAGLTQTALAQAAGIHNTHISALETGRRTTIGPESFARLCDALGVTDRAELMHNPTP